MSRGRNTHNLLSGAAFIILEVASLCILFTGHSAHRARLDNIAINLQSSMWGWSEIVRNYFTLNEENARLSDEIERLGIELRQMKEFAADTEAMGTFVTREHFRIMRANIVTMTIGSQHNYLILDRGAQDGIREDDGVITGTAVIGIVRSVSEHFCKVISFTNQDIILGVRLYGSNAVGSLRWDGKRSDHAILSDVPIHVSVKQGDTVCTSGFSSIFPAGINLGTISSGKERGGKYVDFDVKLFTDITKVHSVHIVQNMNKDEIEELSKKEDTTNAQR